MEINIDMVNKKQKTKSRNFSASEEEELMRLAEKYWLVIQCKKTDHTNNLKKKEYWKRIEDEFNAGKPEYFRSAEVLRTKLENILRRAKQKKGACRKYDTDTGGGPAKYEKFESADETALALLGTRAEGLPNSWCDDEIKTNYCENEFPDEEFEMDALLNETDVEIVGINELMFNQSPTETRQKPRDERLHASANRIAIIEKDNHEFAASIPITEAWRKRNKMGPRIVSQTTDQESLTINDEVFSNQASTSASQIGKWAKYSPAMLRQAKSGPLQIKKNKLIANPLSQSLENNAITTRPVLSTLPDNVSTKKELALSTSTLSIANGKENEKVSSNTSNSTASNRMRVFQDKMSGWIKDKALFTTQQVEALKLETEAKQEIWQLKIEREKELTKLLKEEVTERIRQQAAKHTAELELIMLQKNKILHNM